MATTLKKLSDAEITQKLAGLKGWQREGDAITKEFVLAGFTEATEFLARTLPPSRIEKSRSNSFKTPPSLFPNLPRGTDLDGQIEEKQCGS